MLAVQMSEAVNVSIIETILLLNIWSRITAQRKRIFIKKAKAYQ